MNKNKNTSQLFINSIKSFLKKIFSINKTKYIVGTVLGVTLLVLTMTFSNPSVVKKSYALGSAWSWNGYYTVENSNGTAKNYGSSQGFDEGYFYINIYKGDTKFSSATYHMQSSKTCVGCTPQQLYDKYLETSSKWTFSKSNGTKNSGSWIMVGANSSQEYGTKCIGLNQKTQDDGHCFYVAPTISIQIPKGYYFAERKTSYDENNFSNGVTLVALYCKYSPYGTDSKYEWNWDNCTWGGENYDKMLYANNPKIPGESGYDTPTFKSEANDRWTSGGRLEINLLSARVTTRKNSAGNKYLRSSQSYNVRFLPNKTTITFDANGGSGALSSQTKTFDKTLTLSTSKPTRPDYTFTKWCTGTNGTGSCYSSGEVLKPQIWPTASSVTLYAQWKKDNTPADEWCGYTVVGSQHAAQSGWKEGKGYIHLGKCDIDVTDLNNCTGYSSTELKSTLDYGTTSTDVNTYYNYIMNNSTSATFSITNGDTSNFELINTTIDTETVSLNSDSMANFIYFNGPTVRIKAPKGYKYWTYQTPYPSELWAGGNAEFSIRENQNPIAGTTVPLLLVSNPGPYQSDTWLTGKLAANTASFGNRTASNYRVYKAQCIAFKPNSRKIYYRGNGSDNPPDEMGYDRYVYNDENEPGLTIADNEYQRNGYNFLGWNTESDGTGTWYEEGEDIAGNKWPGDSSDIFLYAQWGKNHTATIYYNASNEKGETNIQSQTLTCHEYDSSFYNLYPFRNTSNNYEFIYVRDSQGNPVPNISLVVADGEEYMGDGSEITDSDGKIRTDNLKNSLNESYPLEGLIVGINAPYGNPNKMWAIGSTVSSGTSFDPNTEKYYSMEGKEAPGSCYINIPEEITDSVGTYNNAYAGLASSYDTMNTIVDNTTSAVKISSDINLYTVYRTTVRNYYYKES